jgi:septal ring factor EnvC (AmiA/AmiB activator)
MTFIDQSQLTVASLFKLGAIVVPLSLSCIVGIASVGSYKTDLEDHLKRLDDTAERLGKFLRDHAEADQRTATAIVEVQKNLVDISDKMDQRKSDIDGLKDSVGRVEDKLDGIPASRARNGGPGQ